MEWSAVTNSEETTRFEDVFETLSEESKEYICTVIHSLSAAQNKGPRAGEETGKTVKRSKKKQD